MKNEMTGIALVSGLLWGGIAFAVLPDAADKTYNNEDTLIIEHKLSLIDEQIDDEEYYASEQYRVTQDASKRLRKIRGDSDE